MAPTLAPTRPRWRAALALLALAAAVALAHGAAVGHGFVHFDDDVYVYANPEVLAGLTADGVRWAFTPADGQTYFHPVTWLSLMADATLAGDRPGWFHLVNLLLHGANAALLLALLSRVTGRPGPSLAAALLWAVHPLTVEAVAWVTERKTVLSTAFGLLSLLVWTGGPRPRPWPRAAGAAALLALGLLAKPGLVALPLLAWLLDEVPVVAPDSAAPPRPSALRRLLATWPLALTAACGLALALHSAGRIPPESSLPRPLPLRALHALASLPTYLGATLWPDRLAAYHPYPAAVAPLEVAFGGALLLLGSTAALRWRRRWPLGALGGGWFLAALAPYLGLAQAGLWPGWAERFAYLPLAGLCALLAFGAADLLAWRRAPRGAGPLLAALALLALLPVTRAQVAAWQDSVTLFTRSAAAEPESAVLRFDLGAALLEAGRPVEAEPPLREAVRLVPRYPNAWAALGLSLLAQRRSGEAVGAFRRALADLPDHPDALFGCAEALRQAGRPEQARPFYRRYLEVAPPGATPERATALIHAG